MIEEYKILLNDYHEKLKNYYVEFMGAVERIYNEIIKYLGLDKKDTKHNISTNIDVKAPVGSLIGKIGIYAAVTIGIGVANIMFPPLVFLTLPVSCIIGWFFGKSIGKTLKSIFSKRVRLIEAFENMQKSQIDEITLFKERFLRDLEEKKEILDKNAKSLINIKTLELSSKSKDTEAFYMQLKNDYEQLLNNIKYQFNI